MAVNTYKVGPGELELGSVPLDVSAQVTSCRVVPSENVTTTEAIPVLSGEELPAEDEASYTYELVVTFLQDIAAAGVVDWTWTNKGTTQDFRYVPNTTADRAVSGELRVIPLAIGGDARTRPTSEVTFKVIGTPVFGDATP